MRIGGGKKRQERERERAREGKINKIKVSSTDDPNACCQQVEGAGPAAGLAAKPEQSEGANAASVTGP